MRHTRFLFTSAAVTAIAATAGLGAGSAFASTTPASSSSGSATPAAATTTPDVKLPKNPTLPQLQAAAATDISNRVAVLDAAVAKLQAATDLGGDQATLIHNFQSDISGLQQLGTNIAADITVPAAKAGYTQIFTNFRIYALALPSARLVATDDRIVNTAGPALTKRAALVAARETPANQAEVQPLLADLATQVTAANTALDGQTAALIGYTPADWNANHTLLVAPRGATKTATADLVKARHDLKQAVADVRR